MQHINEKYKYSGLTSRIIGCSIEVHKHLGNGFQEVIYQRALETEFRLQNINAQREFVMPLFYKGEEIGTRRVDFFVEVGLLINFGSKSLDFKRVMNKKYQNPS